MAENSKIEWTTHTYNGWRGCFKISEGCKNCYAEVNAPARVARGKGVETWGKNAARILASEAMWKEPEKWERQAAKDVEEAIHDFGEETYMQPERPRVFCASLADVFEDYQGGNVGTINRDGIFEKVYDDLTPVRARLFDLIRRTPHLDWLLLTKRPENVMRMIAEAMAWMHGKDNSWKEVFLMLQNWLKGEAPHNVWMGTTVENQQAADTRIKELLMIPAKVRFLSCEPLLGPVELSGITFHDEEIPRLRPSDEPAGGYSGMLHWVICGGESGPNARPMHPNWARSLMAQCVNGDVPFLFKQWGEWVPCGMVEDETQYETMLVEGTIMCKVGKKAAGRSLDGVIYHQFPKVGGAD